MDLVAAPSIISRKMRINQCSKTKRIQNPTMDPILSNIGSLILLCSLLVRGGSFQFDPGEGGEGYAFVKKGLSANRPN